VCFDCRTKAAEPSLAPQGGILTNLLCCSQTQQPFALRANNGANTVDNVAEPDEFFSPLLRFFIKQKNAWPFVFLCFILILSFTYETSQVTKVKCLFLLNAVKVNTELSAGAKFSQMLIAQLFKYIFF
jgi:hypothetical protein